MAISFSTITGNGPAGGIYNSGTLILSNCAISQNYGNASSGSGAGAGIFNVGTLTISDSTFSGNFAQDFGGAIYNFSPAAGTRRNSKFSANRADARAGG